MVILSPLSTWYFLMIQVMWFIFPFLLGTDFQKNGPSWHLHVESWGGPRPKKMMENSKFFIFCFFRLNQSMSYSFNISLLILLKTNCKIAFLDAFVTVFHLVFFKELFFIFRVISSIEEIQGTRRSFQMWFFSSCSINFTLQNAVMQCALNLT